MSFLVPAALGLSSLALPLIALYMLRSRRERLDVSSLLLWETAADPLSSARPWRPLKITPLLLIQLAVLAAFVVSLARPFGTQEARLGAHTVLILDVSGSMGMAGRFERAKREAQSWAGEMSGDQLVSVVEAGARPRVVAAYSRDVEEVTEALSGMELTGGEADLGEAVRLGRGLSTPDRPSDLVLFTDGGEAPLAEEPIVGARHVRFDETGPNRSLQAFTLERDQAGVVRALVSVADSGGSPDPVTVEVEVDGRLVSRIELSPPPNGADEAIIPLPAGPGAVARARLVGPGDSLPADDEAWAVLATPSATLVGLEGVESPYLAALVGSIPEMEAATDPGATPEISIVNRGTLPVIERPSWLIRTEETPPGLRLDEMASNLGVTWQRPGEPVLDDVALAGMAVAEAQVMATDQWLPVVKAGDIPLVFLGRVNGHRVVYFAFDLTHSNLVVQVDFPLLGVRLLEWLAGEGAGAIEAAPAGQPIPLASAGGGAVQVLTPDGESVTLGAGVAAFSGTGDPGVYRVDYMDQGGEIERSEVAVRHFAVSESAGRSRPVEVEPGPFISEERTDIVSEWGPWVAGLAAALMLVEWWMALRNPGPTRLPAGGSGSLSPLRSVRKGI